MKGLPGTFHPFKTDITNESEVVEAFRSTSQKLGPINVLVNNAGVSLPTTLSDGDSEVLAILVCFLRYLVRLREWV